MGAVERGAGLKDFLSPRKNVQNRIKPQTARAANKRKAVDFFI